MPSTLLSPPIPAHSNTAALPLIPTKWQRTLCVCGLKVGQINAKTYDSHPYRRVELLRRLLNTLQLSEDGRLADWQLVYSTQMALGLKPEDSEGLIDTIRAIEGVEVAVFYEELTGRHDSCQYALEE